MKTTLFQILKNQGLFSNDIKSRMKNKQIKMNGETVTSDFAIDVKEIIDIEDFVSELCQNEKWFLQMKLIGIDNILFSNIQTDLKYVLIKNPIIRTSKKHSFVIKSA